MLRRIARPMLAAWFVTEGSAAVRGSAVHLEPARAGADVLVDRFGIARPSDEQLRTIVKVHGAATIGAGAALAIGKAPRLAALVLAALTLPSAVANVLASRRGGVSAAAKTERRQRAVQAVSFTGAALIAAADREGRPGLAWKVSRARKLAAASATATVAGATHGSKKSSSTGATDALKKAVKGAGAVAAAKATKDAGEKVGHGAVETVKAGKRAEKKALKAGAKAAKHAAPVAAAGRAAKAAGKAGKGGKAGASRAAKRADAKSLKATRSADTKAARSAAVAEATAAKLAATQAASAEKAARVAEAQAAKAAKRSRRRRTEDVVVPG